MSHLTELGRDRGVGRFVAPAVFIGAIGTLALCTAWALLRERNVIAQSTANADLAAVAAGGPCPAVSAAVFGSALKAQELKLKYVFNFNGDVFGRAIGDADCDVATAKGGFGLASYNVCEFTSPTVLYVKTGRGEFFFLPGVGHKATVSTAEGVARCMLVAPKLDY